MNPPVMVWTDDELEPDYRCPHARTELRERTFSNGTRHHVVQCVRCGSHIKAVRQDGTELPMGPFDEELPQRYYAVRHAYLQRKRQERAEDWQAGYPERQQKYREQYLRSPDWKNHAAKVIRRAGGVCECCLEEVASEVHHETYQYTDWEHPGREPAWVLHAICRRCHDRLEQWKWESSQSQTSKPPE